MLKIATMSNRFTRHILATRGEQMQGDIRRICSRKAERLLRHRRTQNFTLQSSQTSDHESLYLSFVLYARMCPLEFDGGMRREDSRNRSDPWHITTGSARALAFARYVPDANYKREIREQRATRSPVPRSLRITKLYKCVRYAMITVPNPAAATPDRLRSLL